MNLSIFLDESGDIGEYQPHSPYYVITMVFHDQSYDLTDHLKRLDQELSYLGYDNMAIHTEPLVRREEAYSKNNYCFDRTEKVERGVQLENARLPFSIDEILPESQSHTAAAAKSVPTVPSL